MEIRRNKSYSEFCAQSKAKQIFTPWFIAALVFCLCTLPVALAMVALLSVGFEAARSTIDPNTLDFVQPQHVADITKDKSLMSYVEYDPHANYQVWFKTILAYKQAHGEAAFAQAVQEIASHHNSHSTLNYDPKFIEAVNGFLHSHAQGLINHNGTWGFAVKVLGGADSSWFYKFTNEFKSLPQTVVDSHNNKLNIIATNRIIAIENHQGLYHTYYWIFIVCMMPQMINFVIIVVKLATVLNPKLSAEAKQAKKAAKLQKKLQRKQPSQNLTSSANYQTNLEAH